MGKHQGHNTISSTGKIQYQVQNISYTCWYLQKMRHEQLSHSLEDWAVVSWLCQHMGLTRMDLTTSVMAALKVLCFDFVTETIPVFWLLLISTLHSLKTFSISHYAPLLSEVAWWTRSWEQRQPGQMMALDQRDIPCHVISQSAICLFAQRDLRERVGITVLVGGAEWCLCITITPSFAYKTVLISTQEVFLLLPHSTRTGSEQTKVRVLSSSPGSTHHRKLHVCSLSAYQRERELCITWYYSELF